MEPCPTVERGSTSDPVQKEAAATSMSPQGAAVLKISTRASRRARPAERLAFICKGVHMRAKLWLVRKKQKDLGIFRTYFNGGR